MGGVIGSHAPSKTRYLSSLLLLRRHCQAQTPFLYCHAPVEQRATWSTHWRLPQACPRYPLFTQLCFPLSARLTSLFWSLEGDSAGLSTQGNFAYKEESPYLLTLTKRPSRVVSSVRERIEVGWRCCEKGWWREMWVLCLFSSLLLCW